MKTLYLLIFFSGFLVFQSEALVTDTIPGCTDPKAANYLPEANRNDGSCEYVEKIWGCTDPSAENYDSSATHNDGYCEYLEVVKGCTDELALNYDPSANYNDRSCVFPEEEKYGCTDPFAKNYNPNAAQDNGSCEYEVISDTISGCTDVDARNYNPLATSDNGSCMYDQPVGETMGCTDPKAVNYNPDADVDDGSCLYSRPVDNYVDSVSVDETLVEVGTSAMEKCDINYDERVDSVLIKDTVLLNDTELQVSWEIWQSGLSHIVTALYEITESGNFSLFLSLYCNQGILKSTRKGEVKAITINKVMQRNEPTYSPAIEIAPFDLLLYPSPVREVLNMDILSEKRSSGQISLISSDGSLYILPRG